MPAGQNEVQEVIDQMAPEPGFQQRLMHQVLVPFETIRQGEVFGQARNDAVRRARIGAQNRLTTDPLIKHEITLDGADCLPRHSPRRRVYGVDNVVSPCCQGGRLRLGIYPLAADLALSPADFCRRGGQTHLLAENVQQCRFTYQPASLTRSAIVRFFLEMRSPESEETVNFLQEVQIRNVP